MMPIGAPPSVNYSVVPAVVTDNQDGDKLGRVKVRFPWMEDDQESDWIRVAAPGAGKQRGLYFIPEVDDQVLVAFSYGRVDRGYVIGSLWSSGDKPPKDDPNVRVIQSVSGHVITLDDTKDAELVKIVDKEGNTILLDAKNKAITIESVGDLTIKAKGKLTLKSTDDDVSIKGSNVSVEADSKVSAKGQQMALDGQAGVKVNGGALEVM